MNEIAIVNKVHDAPDLWIERLVIYKDYEKNEVIRDLPFSRGLNIVWGVSQAPQDTTGAEGAHLVGHSVGKTSLCRLIRYVLDEDSFGQKKASEMIRVRFPGGAVGATVHVKNMLWSIVRRFDDREPSFAARNVSIEALRKIPPNDCSYLPYSKALRNAFVHGLPGYEEQRDKKCAWRDLLAWMSRDQEARYQDIWKWRDHRSGAQSQSLSKDDALKLMRSVIGIYSEQEESLLAERERLTQERNALKKTHDQAETDKKTRSDFLNETIVAILDAHHVDHSNTSGLFGLSFVSDTWVRESREQLGRLRSERLQIQSELARCRARERVIQDRVTLVLSNLRTLKDGRATATDNRLREMEARQNTDCTFGDIAYAKCEHFQTHLRDLTDSYADFQSGFLASNAGCSADDYQKAERTWVTERLILSAELADLMAEISSLETKDEQFEESIVRLYTDICRMVDCKEDKGSHRSDSSDEIYDLGRQLDELQQAIKNAESSIVSERVKHRDRCFDLESSFNRLIQYLLSSKKYQGRIFFPPADKLDFRIDGLSGEAVQTFTCIAADIAALLWSVEGKGHHPRFLIHDSPREADLSGTAYASFLIWMHRLSESLGGENAPFQYFVTTTTNPPQELVDAGCVRLRLASIPMSDMLYGDNIELTLAGMDGAN